MRDVGCKFAVLLVGSILGSQPIWAQDVAPAGAGSAQRVDLGEIVVTAQRREESLQDVPVAVTALNPTLLERARITNIQNMASFAPNLQVNSLGLPSTSAISIRGISSGVQNNAVDPRVGIYVDGVYIGRAVGAMFDLADIARVEVLRGPQGTLFGRNATSGAISITTAAPTGELGARATLSYGNYDALRAKVSINLPLGGPFSARFSYLHDEMAGDGTNLLGGQTLDLTKVSPKLGKLTYATELGRRNVDAVQAAVRGDFGDLLVDYRFDYTDSNLTPRAIQALGPITPAILPVLNLQPLVGGVTNLSNTEVLKTVANSAANEHIVVQGHSLTLALAVNEGLTLKSISGFRKQREDPYLQDPGAVGGFKTLNASGGISQLIGFLVSREQWQKQFSQELQAQVTNDAFNLTAGAFYFRETGFETTFFSPFRSVTDGVLDGVAGSAELTPYEAAVRNKSYAAYAQATLHLTDKFDLSGGLRYTIDERQTDLQKSAQAVVGALDPGLYNAKFKKLNYTAIATYRPKDDINIYLKAATGYNAGGIFNGLPFDPETITSYEAGFKAEFFARKLRTNAAFFLSKYDDLQVQDADRDRPGVTTFQNAGKATVKGFELEVDLIPVRGITLNGSVGYNDFKYDVFVTSTGVDLADIARPFYLAKWTGRLAGEYATQEFASGGYGYARLDGRYRSKAAITGSAVQDPTGVTDLDRLAYTGAGWVVDGRIGLADLPVNGAELGVSLYGQNLFDAERVEYGSPIFLLSAQYSRGRTYGLEVALKF